MHGFLWKSTNRRGVPRFSVLFYGEPVTVDHEHGPPPWMQVAAILRDRIRRGEITGKLPSETTLAQEYDVAKGTVRKALAALREEGLVSTVRGWGSYVAPPAGADAGR
jgi:DNA-binding GntR family transcriptional regulator